VTTRPGFTLVASNGRIVLATRRGAESLSYKLLEGLVECGRHEIKASASDAESTVRDHRRRRSVAIASGVQGEGWVPLPDGSTLAIDRRLSVTIR
jgi:glutamine amidotransferase